MKKLPTVLCSLFTSSHRSRLPARRSRFTIHYSLIAVLCSLFTVHLLVKPALAASDCSLPQCQTGKSGITQDGAVRGCDGINPPGKYQCSGGNWIKISDNTPESGGAAYNSQYAKWYRKDPKTLEAEKQSSPENEVNAPKFAASSVNYVLGELTGQSALASNNVVMGINSAIAYMTVNRPAKTSEYIAYLGQKSGFQAYAAGQRGGFDLLKPIQKIWIATRNVAYLITSLTLVVIGFMIMLRKKIDAQTVIGVQQALPKLVVTLLLITFSYAIVGFVIDMIYFLIFFMINLAVQFGVYDTSAGLKTMLTERSALGIVIREFFWSTEGTNQASDAIGAMVEGLINDNASTTRAVVGSIGDFMSQPIAWVIVTVAVLYAGFKLFFSLLMAYIQIIVGLIIGPLQIMMNALPGSDAFSKWLRNLLANALAFPATAAMFLFAAAMMGLNKNWGVASGVGFQPDTIGEGFLPPFIGFGGAGDVNAVQALIGLGIILMTPKVVDMVKEWVQAPEFKYGSAIGEAVGFGGRAPGYITRTAGSGREYAEALRYSDPASPHYDPNYLQQLMFTNPQLFTRVNRALSGGTRGRIIQGLGHTFGIGRK